MVWECGSRTVTSMGWIMSFAGWGSMTFRHRFPLFCGIIRAQRSIVIGVVACHDASTVARGLGGVGSSVCRSCVNPNHTDKYRLFLEKLGIYVLTAEILLFNCISENLVLPSKYQLLLTLSAKPNLMPVSPTVVMNFAPYKHGFAGGKAWWKVAPTTSCLATRQPPPSPWHQAPTSYEQMRNFHLRNPLPHIPLRHAANPPHLRGALTVPKRYAIFAANIDLQNQEPRTALHRSNRRNGRQACARPKTRKPPAEIIQSAQTVKQEEPLWKGLGESRTNNFPFCHP